ncbi:MAG: hypothetical protein ABIZ49_11175 [Opitutaceae bacterium]
MVAGYGGVPASASSGIARERRSRREDVVALAALAKRYGNLAGVTVGKAIYEKRVELGDLLEIVRG